MMAPAGVDPRERPGADLVRDGLPDLLGGVGRPDLEVEPPFAAHGDADHQCASPTVKRRVVDVYAELVKKPPETSESRSTSTAATAISPSCAESRPTARSASSSSPPVRRPVSGSVRPSARVRSASALFAS